MGGTDGDSSAIDHHHISYLYAIMASPPLPSCLPPVPPCRCAASTSTPPPPLLQVRCLYLHTGRVNDLSFDSQEEHIASCSDDCTVAVSRRYVCMVVVGGHDAPLEKHEEAPLTRSVGRSTWDPRLAVPHF